MQRWNSKIASLAQKWSNRCQSIHGRPIFEASEYGFNDFGQINWPFVGDLDPKSIVAQWEQEKQYYNVGTGACVGGSCSTYKQVSLCVRARACSVEMMKYTEINCRAVFSYFKIFVI